MTLNFLIVIIILGGWLFGRIFSRIKLPAVLGMIAAGILIGLRRGDVPNLLWDLEPFLKSLALIVILLRAGLGINRQMLRKAGITAILMSFVPCLLEGSALTLAFHFIFGFNWIIAALPGFMLAAVSPAVIVPSMINLQTQGRGRKNEVPTIILAGASADDVFAITIFSVFMKLAVSGQANITHAIISIPSALALGIIPGIFAGLALVWYFKHYYDRIRATEKTIILLMLAVMMVGVGDLLHSAALLGVMTVGFIIFEKENRIAHEISSKLAKIWIPAEIVLFVLIGISVDLNVAADAGLKGAMVIGIGLIFRSLGVLISTAFSKLSLPEKMFCVIAYLPKATVQAALGSVPLAAGLPEGQIILAIAVLSIVLTAPLGLILINIFGPKLLAIDFQHDGTKPE
ncbi:MAG: cation:proton antiporter [Victivallaceae bacterium]